MKLHYRGNCYESHPQIIETHETEITAKFRSLTYQVRSPLKQTCSQPLMNLKYRGNAYKLGQVPAIKTQTQPQNNDGISYFPIG
jgi:hypothetical protein